MKYFKVPVRLRKRLDESYEICIGENIFPEVFFDFLRKKKYSKIGIITDSNVFRIYRDKFKEWFKEDVVILTFEAGEKHKNIDTVLNLISQMISEGFDRKSLLVALGGGVTGDITGFVASIFMRGIPYIQVPTTLLAMVDSSIGGKTGVDTTFGKNLIGTFFQPEFVIIDVNFLKTLPYLEVKNGFAEVIKHSLIMDERYFSTIESLEANFLKVIEPILMIKIIKRSCEIKSYVVSKDEREGGLRQILNLGHTIGHGIEKLSNFLIPHGMCVAFGIFFESLISMNNGVLSEMDFQRIENLLKKFGYFEEISILKNLDFNELLKILLYDKKNVSREIRVVFLERIGKVHSRDGQFSFKVTEEHITKALGVI